MSESLRGVGPVVRRVQKATPSDLAISAVTAMEAKGHGIALADCQIAATALANGLTLVSNDGDLGRVPGLNVVDWRAVR